jgi:hypothetical protein
MIIGAHSILYSSRPEADRAFLRDVLGLPSVDVGEGWLIFGLPPSEVAVHPSEENDVQEFYLMCDDAEAFIAEMTKRSVACAPAQNLGWGVLTRVTLPGGEARRLSALHARPKARTANGRRPRKDVKKEIEAKPETAPSRHRSRTDRTPAPAAARLWQWDSSSLDRETDDACATRQRFLERGSFRAPHFDRTSRTFSQVKRGFLVLRRPLEGGPVLPRAFGEVSLTIPPLGALRSGSPFPLQLPLVRGTLEALERGRPQT